MIARALAAAAALGLALGGVASADEPAARQRLRLGLDKLRAAGVSEVLAEAVEERVCAVLVEVADADVTCPSDLAAAAVLARTAAVFGECRSDDCMKRVEAVKSADRRVSGSLERGEEGVVLSLQLTGPDGPGPRVVERLPEDLDEIFARLPAAVRKLLR